MSKSKIVVFCVILGILSIEAALVIDLLETFTKTVY